MATQLSSYDEVTIWIPGPHESARPKVRPTQLGPSAPRDGGPHRPARLQRFRRRCAVAAGLLALSGVVVLGVRGASRTHVGPAPAVTAHAPPCVAAPNPSPDRVKEDDHPTDTYGTRVAFARTPAEAAGRAGREGKLLFLLHVSGNFEEARFT